MKLNNIIKFIFLAIVSTGACAQDFYLYKLFDDKFQTVFPEEPSLQAMPFFAIDPTLKDSPGAIASIKKHSKDFRVYEYIDSEKQIAIVAKTIPSAYKYDIGAYKQSYKKDLDDMIFLTAKKIGGTILEFSSVFNRDKDTYTALYTLSIEFEGQEAYISTKYIIYKRNLYTWTINYVNKNDKKIFYNYQKHCKVLRGN